jgi:hypothetical protein
VALSLTGGGTGAVAVFVSEAVPSALFWPNTTPSPIAKPPTTNPAVATAPNILPASTSTMDTLDITVSHFIDFFGTTYIACRTRR